MFTSVGKLPVCTKYVSKNEEENGEWILGRGTVVLTK